MFNTYAKKCMWNKPFPTCGRNKMNVDAGRCADKDLTSISSVLWLNLKVICFFWCLLSKGACWIFHSNSVFTTRCQFISTIWRHKKIGKKWKQCWSTGQVVHKRITSNAKQRLSTEKQNESNTKGEVYPGEDTNYFFTMVLQSC